MNGLKRVITAATLIAGAASPVFAASVEREDNSGLVVWGFLAFCGLIVVGQVFPLIRNLLSVKKQVSLGEPEKVKSEH